MLAEGLWDHEIQPENWLPVCAIFVDVMDWTAHLLKSLVRCRKRQRVIKNRQRVAVLLEMPCHEVLGQPFPAFFLWELGWRCSFWAQQWCLQPALLRMPVGSICSSNYRGREAPEKYMCTSGTKALLLPGLCVILALWIDTDFSSAFLAYQVYIHHPECLFNPIRAVFSCGLDLSLMSAWGQ